MSPTLRIRLLGEFSLNYDDAPLTTVNIPRLQSLLAYLVLHRAQRQRRSVLAGLLDPDAPESHARHALSQAIWQLRRNLPDLIESDRDSVGLSPRAALWVDVLEFERLTALHLKEMAEALPVPTAATACADLHQAIQLYRSDLLEGLYDDWLLMERERLRELYLQALECLSQLEKSAGRYQSALEVASLLAQADPWRSSAQRQVMQLYFCLGRPEAALAQFEAYRRTLNAELGAEPEPETLALARAIAGHSTNAVTHLPDALLTGASLLLDRAEAIPLVGRSCERTDLLSHLKGIFAGVGSVVLIEGEAGIGKTRLLQEVSRDAEWRGAQVLWAHAEEQANPAYGLLLHALANGLSPLRADQISRLVETVWLQVLCPQLPVLAARLSTLPPPAPLDPVQEQARLAEAIARLLAAWAQITPVVVILEDLHWASPDTLDMLASVARQIHSVGVLIFGSYRGDEVRARSSVWDKLQMLDHSCGVRARLALARLDVEATGELIRRALGWDKPAPLFENRLYAETAGNPLFVLETLRALYDGGLLRRDERGEWSTAFDESTRNYEELPLSPVVEHVITLRVEQLARDPRTVLNAAAVLGHHFDFVLLDALCELETPALLAAIGVLTWRGLLIESPRDYYFSHDKVREIVYANLAADERIHLHLRAAQMIEAQHSDWHVALAHHWTQAQVWDKAIDCRRRAAAEASAQHAYGSAVEHLNAALALADTASLTSSARFDLLAAREAALDVLGDRDAQASDLAAMAQLARDDAPRRMLAQQRRAALLAHQSCFDDAQSAAREALALAEQLNDAAGQATALIALGTALNWHGQTAQALPFLRRAVAVCSTGAEPQLEAQAHHALGDALTGIKEYPTARAEFQAALACCERLNDSVGQAEALGLLAVIQMEQGDLALASENYRRAIEICHAIGYRHGEARNLSNYGNVFYFQNQISEALRCYDEAIVAFHAMEHPRGEAIIRANMATIYHEILGDDVAATAHVESALTYYRQVNDPLGIGHCLGVLGEVAQRRHDEETARSLLEEGVNIALEAGERWIAAQVMTSLADVLLDQRRPESALERLDTANAICQELGFKDLAIGLQASRGLALLMLGQPEAALAATAEAVAHLSPGVERAYRIPFAHYQVLTRLGRTDEAHVAVDQAYQLLMKLLSGLSPEQQAVSAECVPEHRAILTAWQAAQPHRAATRLARADAPAGRPLRADEQIEVTWTPASAEDETISDKFARRRQRLLRLLREAEEQGAAPTVDDLANALDVSYVTIRRDLAALRRSGQSAPTRGDRLKTECKSEPKK
jgi:predicted ATPase/DNA-binding SARP family transcriptional activator